MKDCGFDSPAKDGNGCCDKHRALRKPFVWRRPFGLLPGRIRCTSCHNEWDITTEDFENCTYGVELPGADFMCHSCRAVIPPQKTTADPVDHPSHYTAHPSGVECITITEHMNFNLGNAIKYIWRAGLKDSKNHHEDLKKAAWYVAREITRIAAAEKTVAEKVSEEYLRPRQCTVCDKMYVKGSSTCCEACICDFTAACKKAPT